MLYTSEKTGKSYKTEEECKNADAEFEKEEAKKKELVEVKKTRAKEVEDAYKDYLKVRDEAFNKIAEAEKKWIELRNKFSEDYGGYHMTYTNVNGDTHVLFGDLFDFAKEMMQWPFK